MSPILPICLGCPYVICQACLVSGVCRVLSWSGGVRGGRSGSWWCRRGGVAVAVEGARAMRALAYVEAEPDVDISGLHDGLPSVGSFRPPHPCRGTVMTPGAGIHITRRPHPRPVAVFLRMGRVPISGRGRPVCGGNTPPDHERQGYSAIPHSATGPRGAGPTNQCNGLQRMILYTLGC